MKRITLFILLACVLAFLQTASNIFGLEWVVLLFTCFLYCLAGYVISRYCQRISLFKLLLLLLPYFAIIIFTQPRIEDIPVATGAITGVGLGYFVARSGRIFPKTSISLILIWAAAILVVAFVYIPQRILNQAVHALHRPMPIVSLRTTEGKMVTTAEWKGKVVLAELWNVNCTYCIKQFSETQKIFEKYRENPKVIICSVNGGFDTFEEMNMLRKCFPYTFPIYHDADTALAKYLGLNLFPHTLIIDKEGVLRTHFEGFPDEGREAYLAEMHSSIEKLLKE